MSNRLVPCNNCGGDLQVGLDTAFATCRRCGAKLRVIQTGDAAYSQTVTEAAPLSHSREERTIYPSEPVFGEVWVPRRSPLALSLVGLILGLAMFLWLGMAVSNHHPHHPVAAPKPHLILPPAKQPAKDEAKSNAPTKSSDAPITTEKSKSESKTDR